jgi:hypothetical protein
MDGASTPGTRSRRAFEIDGPDGSTVSVAKRYSKGERLAITADGDRVTLDALLLESLSWQRERGVLDDLIEGETDVASDPVPIAGGDPVEDFDTISISNEYSHTTVTKVVTEAGEAIRIDTPGRGTAINLGAETLATLAGVEDTFAFSVWFETPFGPEDAPLEGPL